MLRFLTAGESHGEALVGILEGFPKGVKISADLINEQLRRRQSGFGRGERMRIEKDKARVLSGLRAGVTLGSPIAFMVKNRDKAIDSFSRDLLKALTVPRPAHADLAGLLKYKDTDIRNILERSSARETACRVVVGSICAQLLSCFNIEIRSHVVSVGSVLLERRGVSIEEIKEKTKKSPLNCIDGPAEHRMIEEIKEARISGDTLGGIIEIVSEGVCFGLGSFMHWDRRLDARLSYALMSIPAVKAVEIGLGVEYARCPGSKSHDSIYYSGKKGFFFKTNNSGGIVGGISTGQPIVTRVAMKPIATLKRPLDSVDFISKKAKKAEVVRSDVTAVSACGIVAESMTAFILAQAFLENFSSDTLSQIKVNYKNFLKV